MSGMSVGSPVVPPDWSFGFWISRWGYRNREEVMAVARRMREERVPCDVIHIDPYWMRYHEGHHGDFVWDESAFPDPGGMIDELRDLGFRVSLWESPYVPLDSEMCADGERRGFLMKSKSITSSKLQTRSLTAASIAAITRKLSHYPIQAIALSASLSNAVTASSRCSSFVFSILL